MKKKFYREAHGYKTDEEMINTLKEAKVEMPIKEENKEEKKEVKKKNVRKFSI